LVNSIPIIRTCWIKTWSKSSYLCRGERCRNSCYTAM